MSITACSILKPYEPELGQGNFIRDTQINQLEIGQTPKQVTFILGTALLTGENTEQHWVYPTYSDADGYSKLIVIFTDGLVSDIQQE
jgi:outer membrane protein assembly factor BamE